MTRVKEFHVGTIVLKNIFIGCLIAINIFSVDFFYSIDKQTKNIGFCGTSVKDFEESNQMDQLLNNFDNFDNKKFISISRSNTLKEIFFDISEFKYTAAIIQLPKTRFQTAFLSVSSQKKPEFLLKDLLFKPPKIS